MQNWVITRWYLALAVFSVGATAIVVARQGVSANPLLRAISIPGRPIAVVVDERAGRAFVVDRGTNVNPGTVTVLATRDGTVLNTVFAGSVPRVAAVDSRDAHVFVIDQAGHGVAMLAARSGIVLASVPAFPNGHTGDVNISGPQTIVTDVAVDELRNRAFVAVGSGYADVSGGITVYDARSGHVQRVIEVGQGISNLAVDPPTGHVFALDNVANQVMLIDVASGTLLRTSPVGQDPTAMALDVRTRRLFVASGGSGAAAGSPTGRGAISVIDARSGAVLRTIAAGIAPLVMAIDQQTSRLFVANAGSTDAQGNYMGDGSITMLDTHTGAVLSTVTMAQSPTALAVDARTRRVYVATRGSVSSPGSLVALDARSGALLRTVLVGLNPTSVAVDERLGRVFVTESGGVAQTPGTWSWLPGTLRQWATLLPGQGTSTRVVPAGVNVLRPM